MTGRELHKEWIGKTANSRVPGYVVERLLEACDYKCQGPCHQQLRPGTFDVDHVIELNDWLGDGHGNRESNLQILCRKICHKTKSRIRQVARANESRKFQKIWGMKLSRKPMAGSRRSFWKHKMSGEWIRRDEEGDFE